MITFISIIVGVALAWFFFPVFFDGLEDFVDSLTDFGNLFSFAFSYNVENMGFFRLFIYLLLCVGSGFMTHHTLGKYFG